MHFLKPIRSNNGNVKYEILKYSRVFVLFSKKKANKPSEKCTFFPKNKACNILSIRSVLLYLYCFLELRKYCK